MGKDSHGFGLPVFSHEFVPVLSGLRVSSEEKYGSLRKGPFQMSVTNLLSRGAYDFACRFLCALDEPAVRYEILYTWEPVDIVDLVKDGETEYPSNAGN